jgi:Cu/Ag efflux pump CusA
MFRSLKWALLILVNVLLARIGGLLALLLTHTNFSVSSGVGFLALFWGFGSDRSHHAGVHQPAPRPRQHH